VGVTETDTSRPNDPLRAWMKHRASSVQTSRRDLSPFRARLLQQVNEHSSSGLEP